MPVYYTDEDELDVGEYPEYGIGYGWRVGGVHYTTFEQEGEYDKYDGIPQGWTIIDV